MAETVALGILLPFIGTSLGAAMVFLLKKKLIRKYKNYCLVLLPAS